MINNALVGTLNSKIGKIWNYGVECYLIAIIQNAAGVWNKRYAKNKNWNCSVSAHSHIWGTEKEVS